ncbi:MAG TPA: VOC family protein [Candidatus Binatia bacterium]|nr:VOC family protein [Candidatus Binatia bacterium]
MRLRQLALVARDLDPVVSDLTAVFGIEVAFRDPGVAEFGLRNAVFPVGDSFLEVVSPTRDDATAARYLTRRRGDGGYMAIFQSEDLAAARARMARLGVRIVWEVSFPDIATIHLHPRDVGGAIVSLDEARPPESWRWAGPEWNARVRTDRVREIAGVVLQADDPERLAERWAALLDRPAEASGGGFEIPLERGAVRFVAPEDDRGDGIVAIRLRASDAAAALAAARARGLVDARGAIAIGGVRFELVE